MKCILVEKGGDCALKDSDARAIIGTVVFLLMIFATIRMGIYLRNDEYILLATIMIAGFVAGGKS